MPENTTPVQNETENNQTIPPVPPPQDQQAQASVTPPVQADPDKADADANKAMGILAYFIFFLPLLAAKDSKFARYHANQGLILLIFCVGLWILNSTAILWSSWSFGLWGVISTIFSLAYLVLGILGILGIVNAAKGEKKPMPLIGKLFTIIK